MVGTAGDPTVVAAASTFSAGSSTVAGTADSTGAAGDSTVVVEGTANTAGAADTAGDPTVVVQGIADAAGGHAAAKEVAQSGETRHMGLIVSSWSIWWYRDSCVDKCCRETRSRASG